MSHSQPKSRFLVIEFIICIYGYNLVMSNFAAYFFIDIPFYSITKRFVKVDVTTGNPIYLLTSIKPFFRKQSQQYSFPLYDQNINIYYWCRYTEIIASLFPKKERL